MSDYPDGKKHSELVFEAMKDKTELSGGQVLTLAILAGIYIALGGMFCAMALSFAEGGFSPIAQLLAGAVFTLGLAGVMLAGAELFTGNTMILGVVAHGKIKLSKALRVLPIAYIGNFIGALAVVGVAIGANLPDLGDGAFAQAMHSLGAGKADKGWIEVFFSGILANFLVCLAVWIAIVGKNATEKLLGLFLPVAAFVALGLEHSVANMFILPFAYVLGLSEAGLDPLALSDIGRNLIASTAGNIVGGASITLAYGAVHATQMKTQAR
jgi:formate transporter